jgi:hypothetical protein
VKQARGRGFAGEMKRGRAAGPTSVPPGPHHNEAPHCSPDALAASSGRARFPRTPVLSGPAPRYNRTQPCQAVQGGLPAGAAPLASTDLDALWRDLAAHPARAGLDANRRQAAGRSLPPPFGQVRSSAACRRLRHRTRHARRSVSQLTTRPATWSAERVRAMRSASSTTARRTPAGHGSSRSANPTTRRPHRPRSGLLGNARSGSTGLVFPQG